MRDVVWLASYPKSGNTWMRMLIGCLGWNGSAQFNINEIVDRGGSSSLRAYFEDTSLIDSDLLTDDEIDDLRPALYEELWRDDDEPLGDAAAPVRFVKAHDAYTDNRHGEPVLGGARAAKGAILVVRDPRDVAPSLAHHAGVGVDYAITALNNPNAAFAPAPAHRGMRLRQKLLDWSSHTLSWLEQRDLPVHLVRYEDLKTDAPGALVAAMRFAGVEVARAAAERAAMLASFSNLQELERETGFIEAPNHDPELGFFRRGEAGGWRDELSPPQVARIEARHARVMTRLGYEVVTGSAKGETG